MIDKKNDENTTFLFLIFSLKWKCHFNYFLYRYSKVRIFSFSIYTMIIFSVELSLRYTTHSLSPTNNTFSVDVTIPTEPVSVCIGIKTKNLTQYHIASRSITLVVGKLLSNRDVFGKIVHRSRALRLHQTHSKHTTGSILENTVRNDVCSFFIHVRLFEFSRIFQHDPFLSIFRGLFVSRCQYCTYSIVVFVTQVNIFSFVKMSKFHENFVLPLQ